jgi:hypothetical protein
VDAIFGPQPDGAIAISPYAWEMARGRWESKTTTGVDPVCDLMRRQPAQLLLTEFADHELGEQIGAQNGNQHAC